MDPNPFIESLAARYNVEVRYEALGGSPEAYVINRTIVLDEDLYLPRMNWCFCHELAHVILGHQPQPVTPETEREADELTAELMLPAAEFRAAMRHTQVASNEERGTSPDSNTHSPLIAPHPLLATRSSLLVTHNLPPATILIQLKEMFPHASWEAIARRWAEFKPAVLTIFDNGLVTRRFAPSELAHPHNPTLAELNTARQCWESRTHLTATTDELTIQAYFVDDNRGVERVILLTEPAD
jgi:hypothetical protein